MTRTRSASARRSAWPCTSRVYHAHSHLVVDTLDLFDRQLRSFRQHLRSVEGQDRSVTLTGSVCRTTDSICRSTSAVCLIDRLGLPASSSERRGCTNWVRKLSHRLVDSTCMPNSTSRSKKRRKLVPPAMTTRMRESQSHLNIQANGHRAAAPIHLSEHP